MRIRLTAKDLEELASLYRGWSEREMREAKKQGISCLADKTADRARELEQRAIKLGKMARLAPEFLLTPSRPLDPGPPSLIVINGSGNQDGSVFVPAEGKPAKRAGTKAQRKTRRLR